MQTIGTFITPHHARTLLKAYIDQLTLPEQDCAIGHLFSLDTFNKLMNFINNHNATHAGTDQEITGVRIYHGMDDARNFPDKNDIFLMPVKKNKVDLFPVYPVTNEELVAENDSGILGDAEPCPNKC